MAPVPFPVVCERHECRTGVERERLVAPVLLAWPGWLGAADVARLSGLSQDSASEVLARMRRRGWVASRRVPVAGRWWRRRRGFRVTRSGAPRVRMLLGCAAGTTGLVAALAGVA